MKACLLHTPAKIQENPLQYGEVAEPRPRIGQILVRVNVCGVCRTDLHVIEGELPPKKSPVIPGHQVVGTVHEAGPGASEAAVARVRDGPAGRLVFRLRAPCPDQR